MNRKLQSSLVAAMTVLIVVTACGQVSAGVTERVSVNSSGVQGNGGSSSASISADGRFVVFTSRATNLVPNDTNSVRDVFVHDRLTGQTTRVSVSSEGVQGNGESGGHSISADGRFVAFYSNASNLVANDTNGTVDTFVHDRLTGQTTRVSVSSEGVQGNGPSPGYDISAAGRFVTFRSEATNLVHDDTNNVSDAFVHDRLTGQTTRISVSSEGIEGNGDSFAPWISADGRFLAFRSLATNLVPNDTNNADDVFVHDRLTGETTRISVSSEGVQGNDDSGWTMSISADGRFIAFESYAKNLVANDTNLSSDVFVHDRLTGQTERVNVDSSGVQADFGTGSGSPSISADGRYVAFRSSAGNLAPGVTDWHPDIFVRDRLTGQTTRVSVSSEGVDGNDESWGPYISARGRFVVFESQATNFVPSDTNGVTDVFLYDRGQQPTDTPCSATLSSDDLKLHIPVVDFQGSAYWADFQYVPNTVDFVLTDAGPVLDDTNFHGYSHSVATDDFTFILPDVIFVGRSYWAQLTYKEGLSVTLTGAGEN